MDTIEEKTNLELNAFLAVARPEILRHLKSLVRHMIQEIKANPDLYIGDGDEEPSIDVRLCVDKPKELSSRVHPPSHWTWVVHTGSSDYDTYHSDYCAGSSVGIDTDAEELVSELIGDLGNRG